MYIVHWVVASRVNALLECAIKKGMYLTPLHLQKLLYIDYGVYLYRGFDVLEELDFVAWPLGAAIPSLYHYYKHLGAQNIEDKVLDEDGECYTLKDIDKTISNYTIDIYGHLDSTSLIRLSMSYRGAWNKAFKKNNEWGEKINHKDIKDEFIFYGNLGRMENEVKS